MKKKILSVFVSAIVAATTVLSNVGTAEAGTDKFTDIKAHWGESIINEAAGLGIVGGYPEGDFKPDNLMKREEFYKLITNVLTTVPDTSNTVISFKDVDPIEWYVPTIKVAVAAGITSGYQDGTFGIGQMISRQEAAKVVASVIQANNLDTTKTAQSAKDAKDIGDWALSYVNLMFQKGYMQGDDEGNFRPTMALTRAEAATLLLNVKKKESVIVGPGNTGTVPVTTTGAVTIGDAGCQNVHAVSDGAFTFGTGTQENPYQISTEAQLNHIRQHVGETAYYILTKDITVKSDFAAKSVLDTNSGMTTTSTNDGNDWGNGNFVPIGNKGYPFKGNLDGNGHTISGLEIRGTLKNSTTGADYSGLFGYIDASGSVKDVTVEDSKIAGNRYTGGIAGYNAGTIKNCMLSTDSTVTGASYIGGITGYTETALKSNVNKGTVEGTEAYTGGIVGYSKVTGEGLLDCVNKGSVGGGGEGTGGIVGYLTGNSSSVSVKSCGNQGKVTGANYNTGGIVGIADGSASAINITDCYNEGELTGKGVIGGIAGYVKNSNVTVSTCHNTAKINGESAGGIVGNNEGVVEYCYNQGKIIGNGAAGGIASYQSAGNGRITKCYNDGDVTANSNSGGIIGQNSNKVNNCYNTGKIKATNAAGGIAGQNVGVLLAVYNVGEVEASNGAGALVGRNSGQLTNSFWLEDSADTDVGLTDASAARKNISKVTTDELSGQSKVGSSSGYQLITKPLNDAAGSEIWEFTYKIDTDAVDNSSDKKGNTISSADIDDTYIYPSIIKMERK